MPGWTASYSSCAFYLYYFVLLLGYIRCHTSCLEGSSETSRNRLKEISRHLCVITSQYEMKHQPPCFPGVCPVIFLLHSSAVGERREPLTPHPWLPFLRSFPLGVLLSNGNVRNTWVLRTSKSWEITVLEKEKEQVSLPYSPLATTEGLCFLPFVSRPAPEKLEI